MTRYPNIVNAYRLARGEFNESATKLSTGNWVVARAEGYASFRSRCHAAWLVFTGRADALVWPGQED